MVKRHRQFALFLAGFCVLAATARAQSVFYATDFDTSNTVSGTTSTVTYASPNFSATYTSNTDPTATGPTAPLATQNGWTSTDTTGPIGHGVFSATNPNQINGGTDFVGGLQGADGVTLFGGTQGGALGGIYAPAAQTPYAVPSTASGGAVMLMHAVTVPAPSQTLVFNTDFAIVSTAAATDTFRFVLANGTTPVITINFTPSTIATTPTQDDFSATSGGTTVNSSNGVILNAQYHLKVSLTAGTTPGYTVVVTGGTGSSQGFSGSLGAALTTINQVGASWTLATPTTIADGGYTSAGNNFLAFDNFSVAIPEPSTDAMLVLGLLGLAALVPSRRQRA